MKNLLLLLFTLVILIACDTKNNCEDILCTSPIPFVALNIVNAENGENLFASGIYTIEDVKLLNERNGSVPVWLDSEYNLESAIGEIEGNNKYRLLLLPELEIRIAVQVAPADGSCCSSPTLVSFNVLNHDFEETDMRNYTIYIQ